MRSTRQPALHRRLPHVAPPSTPSRQRALLRAVRIVLLRPRAMTSVSLALALAANVSPSGAQTFPAVIELSSLQGPNGFVLKGTGEYDFMGGSVNRAGDVNGDGIG